MKHFALVIGAILAATPLLADLEILPIDGVGYLSYNMQTGKVTPADTQTRDVGPALWIIDYSYVNYFWAVEPFVGWASLDWGDIAGPAAVGAFGYTEFTNSQAASGDLYAVICLYEEENGWNSPGRVYVAGYAINNIPGSTHPPDEYWGHIWAVEVGEPFVLDGSDLDRDGLGDFGYFQFFSGRTPGCLHGPAICGLLGLEDPNNMPAECPGVEDAFDRFADPSWNNGPNNIDPNDLRYDSTRWWGGGPHVFLQFYFALYAPGCPNRGDSGRYCYADIDGSYDCVVGLGDLSQLLAHFGMTTGATLMDGDVDPYDPTWPGDGDVDLADLAELLNQYGDDCNWP